MNDEERACLDAAREHGRVMMKDLPHLLEGVIGVYLAIEEGQTNGGVQQVYRVVERLAGLRATLVAVEDYLRRSEDARDKDETEDPT